MEPVVKIFAKGSAIHFLLQVAVRGGDDANIDAEGRFAADALELALLENPQELAL